MTLVGNPRLTEYLQKACEKQAFSHAYILSGQAGSGRLTFSRLLACAALCNSEQKPCLSCPACRKILAGIHPDVMIIEPEKASMGVDEVRQLRAQAFILPNESDKKVYIIKNAQALTPSAQNAFLKVLEEPPRFCIFVLICENSDALLQTILSRCLLLSTAPMEEGLALEYLKKHFPDQPTDKLARAARLCNGSIGAAIESLEQQEENALDTAADGFVKALETQAPARLMEWAVGCSKLDRKQYAQLLDLAAQRVYGCLRGKIEQRGAQLNGYSQHQLVYILKCIGEQKENLEFNVSCLASVCSMSVDLFAAIER